MALQTKTLTANGSKGHHTFTLTVNEISTDTVNNTSTLNYILKLSPIQTGWDWSSYGNIAYAVVVGDRRHQGSINNYDGKSTITVCSGTAVVTHDDDGDKDITVSFTISDPNTSVSYTCGNASKSDTMSLTFIPRKSSFTVENGVLGTAQAITIEPKSDEFTHTLTYVCGTASGTIATETSDTEISFTPPLSLASQNTTGTKVDITYTLETYNGDNLIGSTEIKKYCTIPLSVKPSVSIAITDNSGSYTKYGKYIQGISTLNIELTASGAYGSEVTSYNSTINGNTYTVADFTTDILKNSGNLTLSVTVKDSRGRTETATRTIKVLSYAKPKISALKVYRSDASGNASSSGAYLTAEITATVSTLENKNSASYSLQYKKSKDTSYSSADTSALSGVYSVNASKIIFAADTSASYDVLLTVSDDFNDIPSSTVGLSVKKLWSWLYNGFGWAFGKVAELNGWLDIALKTIFRDEINVNNQTMYGVKTPANDTEAVNKAYVDTFASQKQSNIYDVALPASVDLNSYVTPCEYFCATYANWQTLTNAPPNTTAGIFRVTTSSNGYYIYQEWLSIDGVRFTRTGTNYGASWFAWAKTMTNANITAAYSVLLSFTNGKATYSNSAITANSIVIVQRRSSSVGNNQSFNVSSNAGSVTICTDSSISMNMNINIIIINL